MNKDEYGIAVRLGVSYNISGFSTLSLVFTKPDATTLTVTNSSSPAVSAPSGAASGFSANEYFEYTTADGDIDQSGLWSVRGTYTDGSRKLISDPATFTVDP